MKDGAHNVIQRALRVFMHTQHDKVQEKYDWAEYTGMSADARHAMAMQHESRGRLLAAGKILEDLQAVPGFEISDVQVVVKAKVREQVVKPWTVDKEQPVLADGKVWETPCHRVDAWLPLEVIVQRLRTRYRVDEVLALTIMPSSSMPAVDPVPLD